MPFNPDPRCLLLHLSLCAVFSSATTCAYINVNLDNNNFCMVNVASFSLMTITCNFEE